MASLSELRRNRNNSTAGSSGPAVSRTRTLSEMLGRNTSLGSYTNASDAMSSHIRAQRLAALRSEQEREQENTRMGFGADLMDSVMDTSRRNMLTGGLTGSDPFYNLAKSAALKAAADKERAVRGPATNLSSDITPAQELFADYQSAAPRREAQQTQEWLNTHRIPGVSDTDQERVRAQLLAPKRSIADEVNYNLQKEALKKAADIEKNKKTSFLDFLAMAGFGGDSTNPLNNITVVTNELRNSPAQVAYEKFVAAETEAEKQAQIDKMREWAKNNPVLASLASLVTSPLSGVDYLNRLTQQAAIGTTLPSSLPTPTETTGSLREGATEDAGKVGRFLYNTLMSGADSLIAGAVGGSPVAGGVILGFGAASNTADDIKARGGTDEQALIGGALAGVAEGFFEKFSLGNLKAMKDAPVESLKAAAKNIAKASLVNASEEAATEIANIATDYLLMGGLSNYTQAVDNYMASGMTEREAKQAARRDMLGQVAASAASGALMGLGMGAVGNAASLYNNRADAKQAKTEGVQTTPVQQSAAQSAEESAQEAPVGVSESGNTPAWLQKKPTQEGAETTAAEPRDPMQVLVEARRKELAQQNEKTAAETQRGVGESNTMQNTTTLHTALAEALENGSISEEEYDSAYESLLEMESLENEDGSSLNLYNPETIEKTEVNINGRSNVSYEGSEWTASQSAGEQTGQLAESTGRNQSRQVQRKRAASRRDGVVRYYESTGKQPLSAKEYLGSDKVNKVSTVQEMPAQMVAADSELLSIEQDIRAMGLNPHFFVGDARLKNGNSIDALIRGNEVYVRADSDLYTALQNWNHEKAHAVLSQSPGIEATLYGKIVGKGEAARRKLHQTMKKYRDAYHGIYDVDENGNEIWDDEVQAKIMQEVLADAYAGKDTFAQGVEEYSDVSREAVSQIEERGGEVRGPPEGAMSQGQAQKRIDQDNQSASGEDETQGIVDHRYQNTVDDVLNGNYPSSDSVVMGYTPLLFRKLGMPSLPFVIGPGHIYSIAKTRAEAVADGHTDKRNYHGLGDKAVKNLYQKIQDPVMVIVPKDVDPKASPLRSTHSVVAIVDIGSAENHLLVPVEITAERTVDGSRMDVKVLSSAYERDVYNLVEEAIARENNGEIGVYYAKKEAIDLIGDGLQLPLRLQDAMTSNGIVRPFDEKVNMNVQTPTQSRQFRNWFGDWLNHPQKASKIVNKDGSPKIVYHGTDRDFRIFESKKGTYWFSESEDYAESMAEERGGDRIIPVYLNMRKPYFAKLTPGQFSDPTFEAPIIRAAKAANCDGVIIEADTDNPLEQDTFYVVFDQKNIKSADANIGTFDPNNADVYFSTGTASETTDPIESMPTKARNFMERAEGKLQNSLAKVLGNPKKVSADTLAEVSREITTEFLETGTVSDETIDRTFDKLYSSIESDIEKKHGVDAEDYRNWAERDYIAEVGKHLAELRLVKRYAAEKAETQAKGELEKALTLEDIPKAYADLKAARRTADKAVARNILTERDEQRVNQLLRGDIDLDMLRPDEDNVRGITEVYNAKLEYEKIARKIRQWNATRKGELRATADKLLETASDWEDKRAGWLYSRETMERNILDIVPDKKVAKEINDTIFKPIHDSAAASNKTKNEYRDRVRKMNLSREVAKGNKVSEAAAVQILGEAEDNIRYLQNSSFATVRDGKTLEEWQGVVKDLREQNPQLNSGKIRNAVKEFREIYDELFEQLNDARMRNGYEPINYRKGYFPHFQGEEGDRILAQFGKSLGINTAALQLPTTINGLTHTFKPGMQWFGSAQQRLGHETTFDAVEGFDSYIEGVADVIHQTDNIQRLRAFATQIRTRTADEALKKRVREYESNPNLTEEEKRTLIEKVWEEGKYELGNLAVEVDEYTNLLAGKKSRHDRDMEQLLGRKMYAIMKGLEGRVAANMVAVNPGSWLTNFIPITQGAATLDTKSLLSGMWDTMKAMKQEDGFVAASSFLTNRRGSDPLVRTWAEKVSATLSSPMELIDSFAADTLVRARYNENKRRGLSDSAAMADADAWAAGVMADRSKGAMPTLFSQTNPLTKLFTQFQLEVNNQLSFVFKDIPRETREKGIAALALALFKFMLGAYLYNEIYEYFIGRRPALDPINLLEETVRDVRTDGVYDAGVNLAVNVVEDLPFVGSLLGGGRLPINSALPDVGKLWQAISDSDWDSKKRVSTAAKELAKPATYLALPFGGGQVKKIVEGVGAVAREGSYSVDSSGADILQYPVYANTPGEAGLNAIRAMFFGKSSLPTAREWVESDFDSLGARQTEVYQALIRDNVNSNVAYNTIREWESIGNNKDITSNVRGMLQRGLIAELDVSDKQKLNIYSKLSGSNADARVEKFKRMMDQGLSWSEIVLAFNKQQELNNDETIAKSSEKAAKFAEYLLGTMTVEKALVAIEEMKFYVTMASAPSQEDLKNALNRTALSVNEKRAVWADYSELYDWKAASPW